MRCEAQSFHDEKNAWGDREDNTSHNISTYKFSVNDIHEILLQKAFTAIIIIQPANTPTSVLNRLGLVSF